MAGDIVPSLRDPEPEPSQALVPVGTESRHPAEVLEGQGGGERWARQIAAVKRHKWIVLILTALGTVGGLVATKFVRPVYTVQATVWIESPSDRINSGPIRPEELLARGESYVQLLNSYRVLDAVIKKEKLYLERAPRDSIFFRTFAVKDRFRPGDYVLQVDRTRKRYALSSAEGIAIESGPIGGAVGSRAGFDWKPTPQAWAAAPKEIEFTVLTPREASLSLQKGLTPIIDENGNFLRLSMSGTDRARITSTLNTLTEELVLVAADLKKNKLTETAKILSYQVDTLGQKLRQAESALESFKTRVITQPTEGTAISAGITTTQPTVMTKFFEDKIASQTVRRDRQRLEQVLTAGRTGVLPVAELNTIEAARSAPALQASLGELTKYEQELAALKFRYTAESRQVQDMEEKVRTLRTQTIPAQTRQLASALRAQEMELDSHISNAERELRSIPGRTTVEQRLTRDYVSLAALFNEVQVRYQEAKLAEASSIPDVRVLDQAIQPERPSRNSALTIIFGAMAGSFAAALGLAILLDRLDKRFRYPEQVTRELGLSILGAIPAIKKSATGDRGLEEAAQVVEAFRTIRMNLTHSYGAAGPVMLTVSSPSPGDGKSLVASNLALSFAEAGYRTLLIDGDIRRGELHRMFDTDRRPGLLDCLGGDVTLEQVQRPTSHRNLTLIPCGTRHHHGPELLGSAAMREAIAALKSHYNVIIVDSPPLGAGIDPFVLSTATGNIMLVLRSGETDRAMAEAKLKLLDRLPVRILGAVMNDISTADRAYQYYRYVYGYTADEDAPQLTAP